MKLNLCFGTRARSLLDCKVDMAAKCCKLFLKGVHIWNNFWPGVGPPLLKDKLIILGPQPPRGPRWEALRTREDRVTGVSEGVLRRRRRAIPTPEAERRSGRGREEWKGCCKNAVHGAHTK